MNGIKFQLSGRTAFFKKPDVNLVNYFTYGNIHKVALLGMFGAILGFEGYNGQKDSDYPEFYEKLKGLKVAIEPLAEKGFISKKVQSFNNSVGYASKEEGGNLIVNEQWLENPSWNIYILDDSSDVYKELKRRLLTSSFKYTPYLGKNDHVANIIEVEEISLQETLDYTSIHTLFVKDVYELYPAEDDMYGSPPEEEYKYEERLPIELEPNHNQYITKRFVYTNMNIDNIQKQKVYNYEDKNLYFF